MNDQTGSLIKETPTHHSVQLKYLVTCVSACVLVTKRIGQEKLTNI